MIDGTDDDGYTLYCDNCGEECDELFDSFQDAVAYKVDRDNRWTSVKDKNGDWNEICPSCNAPEVIAELKGIEISQGNKKTDKTAAKLAALAAELFEGF